MALPEPGDPLMLGVNGMVKPDLSEDDHAIGTAMPNTTITAPVAKGYVPKKRRAMTELPADGKTQTLVNVVLVYSLMGLTVNEISITLKCSIADVNVIINLPAYQETFDILFYELISANSKSLQARIASYAGAAVTNVMELAEADIGDKRVPAIVKLKSNQDLLDRAGLAPGTLFNKDGSDDEGDALSIIFVDEEATRDVDEIDIGFSDDDRE